MATPVKTALDFESRNGITNLAPGTATGHPVTYEQLNAAVEGIAWKDNCRVAAQVNVTLSAPGATIDGATMVLNDRFLAPNQTTVPDNGIYLWNGAATPATRALDASTSDELESAVVTIDEGTAAGSSYRQTQVNFTLGTNNVVWSSFGTGASSASETTAGIAELATQAETDAGTDDARIVTPLKLATYTNRAKRYSTNVGDGAATSYTITHNLGTRDVIVQLVENAGSYRAVLVESRATTTNTVTLVFDTAPTSNQYRVVVHA